MKNEELEKLERNYKTMKNKDLSNTLVELNKEYYQLRDFIINLTYTLDESEKIYNKIYNELQHRLKFDDEQEPTENQSGN